MFLNDKVQRIDSPAVHSPNNKLKGIFHREQRGKQPNLEVFLPIFLHFARCAHVP